MNLFWWNKPALKVQDPENSRRGSQSGSQSYTWAGRDVGPEGAMQLATWFSGVRCTAETVGTLPMGFYERQDDGGKKAATDHYFYDLLHDSPNADQTAAEFWEGVIVCLCNHGDFFARKEFLGDRLISLTPVSPARGDMDVKRDENGVLRYRYVYRGKRYNDTEDQIFHIRGFGDGGDRGLPLVYLARQTLAISEAIAASTGATFKNGMRNSVFFTAPPNVKMNAGQRKEFKETFIDPYVGAEAAASAGLLEFGFDVKQVSLSPKDAELLLSWKFSVEEICRWLRIPPVLIGHAGDGQTMWGSGIEQIMLAWLTLGLRPYLTRIEQAIKKRLIVPAQRKLFFAEFNVEGLLRADSAGRAALLSALGQNGYITRNEGRALDNRPSMPGGDILTVQSNLVPLDQLGKTVGGADQQARSAMSNWLFGGDLGAMIQQHVAAAMVGRQSGPRPGETIQ